MTRRSLCEPALDLLIKGLSGVHAQEKKYRQFVSTPFMDDVIAIRKS
jgi:hypothetical protein